MRLEHRSTELVVKANHFVEQLRVLYVVAFLVSVVRQIAGDHLLFGYIFEMQEVALVLVRLAVEPAGRCAARLGEETAGLT